MPSACSFFSSAGPTPDKSLRLSAPAAALGAALGFAAGFAAALGFAAGLAAGFATAATAALTEPAPIAALMPDFSAPLAIISVILITVSC